MRGKKGVRVFMTSPEGRMSPFQQAQMFSLQDPNIHNIAIEGVFDDCQDIVKAVSADLAFKQRESIGTVNSINWARVVAQVVYYFAGYFQATKNDDELVSFAVPSGNFGNIFAGYVAKRMGLPIRRLVLATASYRLYAEAIAQRLGFVGGIGRFIGKRVQFRRRLVHLEAIRRDGSARRRRRARSARWRGRGQAFARRPARFRIWRGD